MSIEASTSTSVLLAYLEQVLVHGDRPVPRSAGDGWARDGFSPSSAVIGCSGQHSR